MRNSTKMNKKLILILFLIPFPVNSAMTGAGKQLATIKPFFTHDQTVCAIKKTIDQIQQKKLCYPDYAERRGIIWSDFWVSTNNPELIKECKNTVKLTRTANILQKQNPESIFQYPTLKNILCQHMLPKIFAFIRTNGWAKLPETLFAQFFLQRCHSSQVMDWHQDPGQDYDTMADFSLVLPLSQQNDPVYGWHGGEFTIREGLPTDPYNESDAQTIIPQYNQAILFNNKTHSHAVTAITSTNNQAQRDLIVVPLYLSHPPKPVVEW